VGVWGLGPNPKTPIPNPQLFSILNVNIN